MALEASCLSVLSIQGKCCGGVIEPRHAIQAIVAIQAAFPGFQDMLLHEIWLVRAVARDAVRHGGVQPEGFFDMAVPARHRCGVIVYLVPDQVETRYAVIELGQRPGVQVIVSPVMFRMTAGAILDAGDLAMNPVTSIYFIGNA